MKSGLKPIWPRRKDNSLIHSYGATSSGLPDNFSIYGGQPIPNQEETDTRFASYVPPMPYGCTGETGAFESGLQDGTLYNPYDLYINTPPGDDNGRDIRAMLNVLINRGVRDATNKLSPKRLAFFNCYGSGAIDDFDAARLGLYINQNEKRGVYIGSRWYWGESPSTILTAPPFSQQNIYPLHCYLATGWATIDGVLYLQVIPWVGMGAGNSGVFYVSREIYNGLMKQPWTGAYTITKQPSNTPVPIGAQAIADHVVYWIKALFHLS